LVGPPLSGKTNVIAQLCGEALNDLVSFYVDGGSLTYGILQHLANIFARELFRASTTTEVRNWLLNGLRNPVDGRLLVVIDGWTSNISAQIRADVEEIIDICKGQAVSIVIALDESSFSSLVSVPGRPTMTELGHSLVKLPLEPLDDDEFGWAGEYFFEKQKAQFYPGSQYNEEYRYPRILRVVAAQFPANRTLEENTVALIPSVTSVNFLYATWHEFASDPTLREDFRKLAKAFLSDKPSRDSDAKMSLLAHGRGYVTSETAERELGTDRLNRLLTQGHVEKVSYGSGNVLIAPKVPELLSSAASYVLADETVVLFKEGQKDAAYQYIVKNSSSFLYGDIVAAMAVIEAAKRNDALLTFIVGRLIEDQPELGTQSKSFNGLLDVPAVGVLPIHSKNSLGGKLISNIHPWLILSHLANIPMATRDGSRDIQLELFYQVGSFPDLLRKPDSISNKIMKGFHVHDIPGVGTLLCQQTGIVEPIMQAILNGFYTMPREMIRLCKVAVEQNLWALWWRLSWAAEMTESCSDPKVAETSKEAITLLSAKGDAFKQMLNDSCRHQTPPDLGKKQIGRNDPCPCGSGRKYKKCCMIH
jgi:hypothetical protein